MYNKKVKKIIFIFFVVIVSAKCYGVSSTELFGDYRPKGYQTTKWSLLFSELDRGNVMRNGTSLVTSYSFLFLNIQTKLSSYFKWCSTITPCYGGDGNNGRNLVTSRYEREERVRDANIFSLMVLKLISNVTQSAAGDNNNTNLDLVTFDKIKKDFNNELQLAFHTNKLSYEFQQMYTYLFKKGNEYLLALLLDMNYGCAAQLMVNSSEPTSNNISQNGPLLVYRQGEIKFDHDKDANGHFNSISKLVNRVLDNKSLGLIILIPYLTMDEAGNVIVLLVFDSFSRSTEHVQFIVAMAYHKKQNLALADKYSTKWLFKAKITGKKETLSCTYWKLELDNKGGEGPLMGNYNDRGHLIESAPEKLLTYAVDGRIKKPVTLYLIELNETILPLRVNKPFNAVGFEKYEDYAIFDFDK